MLYAPTVAQLLVCRLTRHFPLILFAAVAVAGLAMARFAYVASEDAARIRFEAAADEALNRIESRIELHLGLLHVTHAFFAAYPDEVSRGEFHAFFEALQVEKNYGGLRGLGLLAVGRAGEEEELARVIAAYHGQEARIHPPSGEEWVTPVLIYEPVDASSRIGIGFNMYTDPARREAIRTAWQAGEPRASGRVSFDEKQAGQPGVLVFLRLDGAGPDPGAGGRRGGLLFEVLRIEDLFRVALESSVLPVQASVFDGNPAPDNLLFRSAPLPNASVAPQLAVSRPLSVAGRLWTVEFRPSASFSPPSSPAVPVMLGLFGLLLAGAIALIARYQERAYEAAAQLHASAEKSLLEKELMLQEMKHRIKNSIARVLAMARQTASKARDLDEFTASFSARLQAMAASQDLLTRSRWQRGDLGELLRIELGQVFGKELPDAMLQGPRVLLSEATTQALGLTFHELATNALKYGEAGNSPETLKVTWRVEHDGRRLQLTWTEAGGREVTPPEKPGFGTRLIDMNITRELDGTIRRNYRPDGLEIEIMVPLEPAPGKPAIRKAGDATAGRVGQPPV